MPLSFNCDFLADKKLSHLSLYPLHQAYCLVHSRCSLIFLELKWMRKAFMKPFARDNFNLHSVSKESGCAALAIALTLNNLDVPNFLLLIYFQKKKKRKKVGGSRRILCLQNRQTHLRLITLWDGSDETAARPRPPALLLSSDRWCCLNHWADAISCC